jgi:hypothetical protein
MKNYYPTRHKDFLDFDDEEMAFALTVLKPKYVADYYKGIIWSEFEHYARVYYYIPLNLAYMLFNLVVNDLATDAYENTVNLKERFIQHSKDIIADAAWEIRRKQLLNASLIFENYNRKGR